MSRFGNGAFILCLETLFKVTSAYYLRILNYKLEFRIFQLHKSVTKQVQQIFIKFLTFI